jgi:hypothetical protein
MIRSVLAALTLLSATAVFATPAEDELQSFLHKKYNKSGGFLGSLVPDTPTGYAADYEGRKGDGSYWSSAYFNALNVSTAGWPQRALAKHCEKSKGNLVQSYAVRVFDNGVGTLPVKLTDPDGGPDLAVERWMIERWRYGAWHSEPKQGPREWDLRSPAGLIDAKTYLGLFSCQDASAKPLWHVGILPTRFGNIDALKDVSRRESAWFMLSIRSVTAATIANTIAEQQAAEDKERAAVAASSVDQESKQAALAAAGAKRAALLVEFRKQLAIGTRTNCGRVLAFNGPLVEVQVPSHIQLRNGATRVFVEREKIEPDDAEAWGCKWD